MKTNCYNWIQKVIDVLNYYIITIRCIVDFGQKRFTGSEDRYISMINTASTCRIHLVLYTNAQTRSTTDSGLEL